MEKQIIDRPLEKQMINGGTDQIEGWGGLTDGDSILFKGVGDI